MATSTKSKAGTDTKANKTEPRCNASKVKVGSVFSRHSFGVATGLNHRISVRNTGGDEWELDRHIVEREFSFADQYDSEEQLSRTKAIEVMTENSHTAMTINYNKKPDPKVVAPALKSGQGKMSDDDWQAHVEKLMAGEERTIVGYHQNSFDEHQRLRFTEVTETGAGMKLVDPRTLNWVVCNRKRDTVTQR